MSVGARRSFSVGVVSLCVLVGGLVFTSAPALAAAPEAPVTGEASPVTTTTATLNGELGELNPENVLEVGTYEFLYRESPTTCEGGKTVPVPAGVALSKESVSQALSGLSPGTSYTFCLLARNAADETAVGAPVTFTMHGAGITEEQVSTVEAGAATLQADIDPGGSETRYRFEYDTTPYTSSAPHGTRITEEGENTEVNIGAETHPVPVSVRLNGLQPGTTYYYRVVATDAIETFDGPGRTLTTNLAPGSVPPQGCENEQRRAEQPFARALPDCRAYEMVSPVQTGGQDATDGKVETGPRAAISGEAIAYTSRGSFASPSGANLESELISRRGPEGWTTQNITPLFNPQRAEQLSAYQTLAFNPELSEGLATANASLTSEAPVTGFQQADLYLADLATGGYRYVGETYFPMGTSTDLSRVVFGEGGEVSEWNDGTTVPVGVGNEGEPLSASVGDAAEIPGGTSREKDTWRAVSEDGSSVYFTSPGFVSNDNDHPVESIRQLYVRVNVGQPQSPLASPEAKGTGTLMEGSKTVSSLVAAAGTLVKLVEAGATELAVEPTVGQFHVGQPLSGPAFEPGTEITKVSGATLTFSKATITRMEDLSLISSEGPAPFAVGQRISGNGIQPETTVKTVAPGSLTLSKPAAASGGAVELRAGGECSVPADACTVDVSASQRLRENPGGPQPARFWGASADGSRVFFTSTAELTEDADTSAGAANLYEYDLNTNELIDLTVPATAAEKAEDPEGAAVLGVAQISEDGSYVYFVADGELAEGATAGEPNLYVVHDGGAPAFVATLTGSDSSDWSTYLQETMTGPAITTAAVSPGGGRLAFVSERSLTGYDNRQAQSGECEGKIAETDAFGSGSCREVYLYDAGSDSHPSTLVCASCNPSGARPVGQSGLQPRGGVLVQPNAEYRPRNVLEDGTLFFDSSDALVPRASDGRENVYEYEGGRVYAISDVAGGSESFFMDASGRGPDGEEGRDVFFGTADQLLPEDVSNNIVVYDARVGGGFSVTAFSPECSNADSCKPPVSAQPAVFGAPASATFAGAGNLASPAAGGGSNPVKPVRKAVRCARGKRLSHGRCVKKKPGKKVNKLTHRKGGN